MAKTVKKQSKMSKKTKISKNRRKWQKTVKIIQKDKNVEKLSRKQSKMPKNSLKF